jgi:hypothetical protein
VPLLVFEKSTDRRNQRESSEKENRERDQREKEGREREQREILRGKGRAIELIRYYKS